MCEQMCVPTCRHHLSEIFVFYSFPVCFQYAHKSNRDFQLERSILLLFLQTALHQHNSSTWFLRIYAYNSITVQTFILKIVLLGSRLPYHHFIYLNTTTKYLFIIHMLACYKCYISWFGTLFFALLISCILCTQYL